MTKKLTKITLDIPKDLYEILEQRAKENGVSVKDLVETYVSDFLKNQCPL